MPLISASSCTPSVRAWRSVTAPQRRWLCSPGALDWYGDLVLESHGEDSATIKIWPAKERDQDAQDERPIEHMRRVAEAITERGSIKSKAQIEKAVEGKRTSSATRSTG